jgi:hypothetical protein
MHEAREQHEARIKAALESAQRAGEAKVEEAKKEAAAQREQVSQQHSKEMEGKDAQHRKELEAAKHAADKAMEEEKGRASSKLTSEVERMAQERKCAEQALEARHAAATDEAAAAHRKQVAGLEGKVQEANDSIAAKNGKIEGLELEISSLRKDVKARDGDLVEEKERAAKALADERARLKREKKEELDAMLEEHLEETKSVHAEFTQAQALLSERNAQLQEQLDDMSHRFINRESREEDISKIKQLQDEIVQWGNKVKKLEEEMKFYKLELINREDNFNNKFGGGPNVGVIDPLAFGKKKGDEKTRLPQLATNNSQKLGQRASFGSR